MKKQLYFFNKTRNRLLANADMAESLISRLVGLLRTPSLARGQGLYIVPCSQIHMFGMKYAIDALFMDRSFRVVGLCNRIEPGQVSPLFLKAYGCLELPPGILAETGTQEGDEIETGLPPHPSQP